MKHACGKGLRYTWHLSIILISLIVRVVQISIFLFMPIYFYFKKIFDSSSPHLQYTETKRQASIQGVPKPWGNGGYITPNNLTASPPIISLWSASASAYPPIITLFRILALDDLWTFSLVFTLFRISGIKTLQFSVKTFSFFFGLHLICSGEKNSCRASFPQC